jgi:D-tyrosyl-tRNA(Tyr) deacylase
VVVDGAVIAEIGRGLLVLVAVQRGDAEPEAAKLAQRLIAYRVFEDESGRMNRSIRDVAGSFLLVPQFTLAADTNSGLRPSFSRAAAPAVGAVLFESLVAHIAASGVPYACGRFGANMQVALTNEGPVTFWIQVQPSGQTTG